MQHNKVAHLSSSSLSCEDWSSADVYRNSQRSVWEVAGGNLCTERLGYESQDFVHRY